jgi:hypothetical protein
VVRSSNPLPFTGRNEARDRGTPQNPPPNIPPLYSRREEADWKEYIQSHGDVPAYDWEKEYKEGWLDRIKGKVEKKLSDTAWFNDLVWEIEKKMEEEEYKKEMKRLADEKKGNNADA